VPPRPSFPPPCCTKHELSLQIPIFAIVKRHKNCKQTGASISCHSEGTEESVNISNIILFACALRFFAALIMTSPRSVKSPPKRGCLLTSRGTELYLCIVSRENDAHPCGQWMEISDRGDTNHKSKSKNYGKARHLETGDSDTHHHPYRHRNEPGSGELYVGWPLNPPKGKEPHLPQG